MIILNMFVILISFNILLFNYNYIGSLKDNLKKNIGVNQKRNAVYLTQNKYMKNTNTTIKLNISFK